jgi:beta-phosphoglucomutase-like phosphatase (HAD superfamily)
VEDSVSGVRSAVGAGVETIAIAVDGADVALREAGAALVVTSLGEVDRWLEQALR